jgi:hypothetical protein
MATSCTLVPELELVIIRASLGRTEDVSGSAAAGYNSPTVVASDGN